MPSQHGNPRENNPKESKKVCTVFYDLRSEVTFHCFHNILLGTQVSLPKDMNIRKQGPVGTILEGWLPQLDKIILLMVYRQKSEQLV